MSDDAPARAPAADRGGARSRARLGSRLLAGGTDGNERLTVLTGAVLVVLTAAVGVLFAGRNTGLPLGLLHKVAFIAWIAFTALHVLGHLPELLRALPRAAQAHSAVVAITGASDEERPLRPAGAGGRRLALAAGLAAGLVLAVALIGQFSVWTH